jgi:hypothetical protein
MTLEDDVHRDGGGKDIRDPANGEAEQRGGDSPSDWVGPLPAREDAPEPAIDLGVGAAIETVTEDGHE